MNDMAKDRITLAWELRRDIHAWLHENPRAVMVEILDAFSERNRETVRKAVNRMRKDGDIDMLGHRGIEGRYSAITPAIKPVAMVRARLAIGGLKTVYQMHASNTVRNKLDKAVKTLRKAERAAVDEPPKSNTTPNKKETTANQWIGGSIRHVGGSLPQGADQRGQGALRQPVTVNCFQLF